jgi:ferredoxin
MYNFREVVSIRLKYYYMHINKTCLVSHVCTHCVCNAFDNDTNKKASVPINRKEQTSDSGYLNGADALIT